MKNPIQSTLHQSLQSTVARLLLALLCLMKVQPAIAQTNAHSTTLCVATYNLRYASATGPNSWPERRPLINEVIRTIAPDLLGTQEGLYDQLKDIAVDLPEYAWIGEGRDDGRIGGEFMAVFYQKAKLQPLATNHFWLSDTPEIAGSTTWGNKNRRMVTWIQFRDRETGVEFYFFNTHFDHEVQLAREKSAALVRARIAALSTNLPVILSGDFNAAAGSNRAYEILTQGGFLSDAWIASTIRKNEGMGTFNDFRSMPTNGERIDWILTRGAVKVESAEIVTLKPHDQWASDHFPVAAKLVIGN